MLSAIRTDLLLELLPLLAAASLVITGVRASTGFVAQSIQAGHRLVWTRARLATFSRETAMRALLTLLRATGHQPPGSPGPSRGVPVLLVSDPLWGPASFTFLARFLIARGAAVEIATWRPEARTLSERADELDATLNRLRRASGAPQIDVVAAGAGGVITAMAMQGVGGGDRVRRIVAIGVPFRGTVMAPWRTDDGAQQLNTGSLALDGLLPISVPILSVWSTDDPEVVPASSAVADERSAVAIEGCGHLGMLLSARTFRAVHTALDAPADAAA